MLFDGIPEMICSCIHSNSPLFSHIIKYNRPGPDKGYSGFLLQEDEIVPTAEEVWAWHEVAAREIIDTFQEKGLVFFLDFPELGNISSRKMT